MCRDCWEAAGAPEIRTPQVREAASAIDELYEIEVLGGALHIVLDDYNTGAYDVEWCRDFFEKNRADFRESIAEHNRLFELLPALSDDERLSAIALKWGDWSWNEQTDEQHAHDAHPPRR